MLVGVTRDPGQIDTHGYAARFEVERVLSGGFTPGAQLRIGWEEMSPSRRPRFIDGGRVLLALEPLPGYSLWRSRFPGGKAHAVAQRGEAFLRDPDAPTLLRLSQYLSLPDAERQRAAGAAALAALVAESHPDLAEKDRLNCFGEVKACLNCHRGPLSKEEYLVWDPAE